MREGIAIKPRVQAAERDSCPFTFLSASFNFHSSLNTIFSFRRERFSSSPSFVFLRHYNS